MPSFFEKKKKKVLILVFSLSVGNVELNNLTVNVKQIKLLSILTIAAYMFFCIIVLFTSQIRKTIGSSIENKKKRNWLFPVLNILENGHACL